MGYIALVCVLLILAALLSICEGESGSESDDEGGGDGDGGGEYESGEHDDFGERDYDDDDDTTISATSTLPLRTMDQCKWSMGSGLHQGLLGEA